MAAEGLEGLTWGQGTNQSSRGSLNSGWGIWIKRRGWIWKLENDLAFSGSTPETGLIIIFEFQLLMHNLFLIIRERTHVACYWGSYIYIVRNRDSGPGGRWLTWSLPSGKSSSLKTCRRPCPARYHHRCTAGCPGWLGPTSTRQNWAEDAWRKAEKHKRWWKNKREKNKPGVPRRKVTFLLIVHSLSKTCWCFRFSCCIKKKKQPRSVIRFLFILWMVRKYC